MHSSFTLSLSTTSPELLLKIIFLQDLFFKGFLFVYSLSFHILLSLSFFRLTVRSFDWVIVRVRVFVSMLSSRIMSSRSTFMFFNHTLSSFHLCRRSFCNKSISFLQQHLISRHRTMSSCFKFLFEFKFFKFTRVLQATFWSFDSSNESLARDLSRFLSFVSQRCLHHGPGLIPLVLHVHHTVHYRLSTVFIVFQCIFEIFF